MAAALLLAAAWLSLVQGASIPAPSQQQLDWLDLEIGVMFHYTMYTFVSRNNSVHSPHEDCGQVFNADLDKMPPPSTFYPTQSGTFVDQWMEACKAFGAKYVVLVIKHCDGFVTYPTKVKFSDGTPYGYDVQHSSWRDGKGDLVYDFVTSARRHGLIPGMYYSLSSNFYLSVFDGEPISQTTEGQHPVSRDEYYAIVLQQVQEIWGNYGELGELWFDGYDPYINNSTFQEAIASITTRLQPNAIKLQGPTAVNGARKGDGETGKVHDPNWYECPRTTSCRNENKGGTGPFLPAEGEGCAVGTGNSRQWFWHPDHDAHAALKPLSMFWDEYHQSVGLGSNYFLGFTADRRGLVPENDVEKVTAFNKLVTACYNQSVAKAEALSVDKPLGRVELPTENVTSAIDRVWIREDVTHGQRVTSFKVLARLTAGGEYQQVAEGSSVGRKRIVVFDEPIQPHSLAVQVVKAQEFPVPIGEFAAFATCQGPP